MGFQNKQPKQGTSSNLEFNMGLHQDQQTLILSEMMTARRKLEEENQQLRDELYDSRMMIRLLKHQVEQQKKESKGTATVRSNDSTVKAGQPASYFRALEWKLYKNQEARRKKQSRKNIWKSIIAPGKKTFAVVKPEENPRPEVPTIRQPLAVRANPKEAHVPSVTRNKSIEAMIAVHQPQQQSHRPGTPAIQRPQQQRDQEQINNTRRVHSLLTTTTASPTTTKVSSAEQQKHLEPVILEQDDDVVPTTRSVMDKLAKTLIEEYSQTPTEDSSADDLIEC